MQLSSAGSFGTRAEEPTLLLATIDRQEFYVPIFTQKSILSGSDLFAAEAFDPNCLEMNYGADRVSFPPDDKENESAVWHSL